jgi:acyl carrier protein
VMVLQADVSLEKDVADVLGHIQRELPPLKGIVHAAGVTDDALIIRQDWTRFERVLAPKVAGAWNLHILTHHLPLDFFVLFSAGAGIFGSAGQSSYAAANTFLDTLAYHRRALGLPSLSIDWGAWAEVGMASRLGVAYQEGWKAMGIQTIPPEQGVEAFTRLLQSHLPQAMVNPIQWETFFRSLGAAPISPMLTEIAAATQTLRTVGKQTDAPAASQASPEADFRQRFQSTFAADRHELVMKLVQEQVVRVLRIPSSVTLDLEQGLTGMGMDSLMAIELSNKLSQVFQQPLPKTLAFEYPSILALTDYLLNQVFAALAPASTAAIVNIKDQSNNVQENKEVAGLAQDEVESALLQELDDIGY